MANEVRLIDANALMEQFEIEYHHADAMRNQHKKGWQGAIQLLYDAPTIDPESLRPKGRWRKYSSDEWICTNCGYDKFCDTLDGDVLPDFCEGCGAKMEG